MAAATVCKEVEKLFVRILGAEFSLLGLGLRPLLPNPVSSSGLRLLSFSNCTAVSPRD